MGVGGAGAQNLSSNSQWAYFSKQQNRGGQCRGIIKNMFKIHKSSKHLFTRFRHDQQLGWDSGQGHMMAVQAAGLYV